MTDRKPAKYHLFFWSVLLDSREEESQWHRQRPLARLYLQICAVGAKRKKQKRGRDEENGGRGGEGCMSVVSRPQIKGNNVPLNEKKKKKEREREIKAPGDGLICQMGLVDLG